MCFLNLAFSFFPPLPYTACLHGGFLGGVLLLHLSTEPAERFWLLLCMLGWSTEEPGVERQGAQEKSARHRMTHSVSFSLTFEWRAFFFWRRGCAAFGAFETHSPSWLCPPLMGLSVLAFSWLNSKVAGHIPSVMRNLLYQGLSWTGTSPAAWGLHLICI